MPTKPSVITPIRLHLTNVAGAGASQLLLSLLPALERCRQLAVTTIYLPDRGPLAAYTSASTATRVVGIKRILPNALSRVVECLWSSRRLSGSEPLLVLGDLPLRCRAPQTVFVQNAHILEPSKRSWRVSDIKFAVSRWIFRINAKYVAAFVVQTEWMRESLASSYPGIAGKIHVVSQPVPQWMMGTSRAPRPAAQEKLRLIYPSAGYPHKNHHLLSGVQGNEATSWPVACLQLTLPPQDNPAPEVPWIECIGFLPPTQMIAAYQNAHAMVFLSIKESLGFPLIEAMYLGLPIVCADLPYAHALCAHEAIYFNPESIQSFKDAITELQRRIHSGWLPDWREQLKKFPQSWDGVATDMAEVVCTTTINSRT